MSEYKVVDSTGLVELIELGLRKGYWDKALIPELKKRFKELEKKEKLLELYKKLSEVREKIVYSLIEGNDYEFNRLFFEEQDIENQIKELDNE